MKNLGALIVFNFIAFVLNAQNGSTIDPSSIDIVRDKWGVPHIFAKTDPEVAYGLAWAHSEDDFKTLQKTFLASKSMLGLETGRDGAMIDYVVHLLRLHELVDSLYEKSISPQYKEVLAGYCYGINAYAHTHPKEVLVKKLFPIVPQDVLTYSVLQLAVGCGVDDALKNIYHGKIPQSTPVKMENEPEGSNAFAFNSKITDDGNVFLVINTHHPLEGQVSWYEAHLASEEGWNIVGSLFPGSPVIFTGFNENLGWTHTVNHPDKLDIYQLEMRGENSLEYKVDGQWHSLKEESVKLKIKLPGFNLHVKRKTYWSIYGPTVRTSKGVYSIRTAGIMDIRGLEEWYRMNKSRNFNDFRNALKMEAIPGYNFMYGDRYDTIYYLSNGRIPFRDPVYNWQGTLPGNTTRTLWTKFHPVENLPQVMNPSSGYLYNTNHSPFKASSSIDNLDERKFDATMGYETHDNNRSRRIQELMANRTKISYGDFKKIKYDLQLPARLSFPVNIDTVFLLNENENPEIGDIIVPLKNWDRNAIASSHGAAIFAVFFYKVAARYQADESFTMMTKQMCVETMRDVKEYLLRNFGTTEITLGDYQRLERGDQSLPLAGIPDVLAAMYSTPAQNGRIKGAIGDCYIAFAKFTSHGPEIETINCFGASNHAENKHYSDQMPLYQQQKTKRMTLDKIQVYQQAESIYHPEMFSRLPMTARLTRGRK